MYILVLQCVLPHLELEGEIADTTSMFYLPLFRLAFDALGRRGSSEDAAKPARLRSIKVILIL